MTGGFVSKTVNFPVKTLKKSNFFLIFIEQFNVSMYNRSKENGRGKAFSLKKVFYLHFLYTIL